MRNDNLDLGAIISDAYRQRNQLVGDMIAAGLQRAVARIRAIFKKPAASRPSPEAAQRFCW